MKEVDMQATQKVKTSVSPDLFRIVEEEARKMPSRAENLGSWTDLNIKCRILGRDADSMMICVENPRNEIDNPIRYCTQPFYLKISGFVASNALWSLPKEYRKTTTTSLYKLFVTLTKRFRHAVRFNVNAPADTWQWYQFGEGPMAEYYVQAYLSGTISEEIAQQLSGLSKRDFNRLVRVSYRGREIEEEKTIEELKQLSVSDVRKARTMAEKAITRFRYSDRIKRLSNVLEAPTVTVQTASGVSRKQEFEWIRENKNKYKGRWVALYKNRCLASGPSLSGVRNRARKHTNLENILIIYLPKHQ